MKKTEEYCSSLIPTLNGYGYTFHNLDIYSRMFLDFVKDRKGHVLDIGAAFGNCSIRALQYGAHVYANDLDVRHLEILYANAPISCKKNLTIMPGRFEDIQLPDNHFTGVLASGVLHYIRSSRLEYCIKKIFDILTDTGRFYYFHSSPFVNAFKGNLNNFYTKKEQGVLWPGEIHNCWEMFPLLKDAIPDYVNLVDIDMAERIIKKAGFKIIKSEYISMPHHSKLFRASGNEYIGIIAEKPKPALFLKTERA